ncbi:hypothetical protein [Demequina aurantiaca]|uniref:hypothetical protein n=1 Tax=Demequina aurantiaca TaxID=676200 RepID=UPI00078678E2|nr:hypothetical protein [Demequina aurantiaca]
MSTFMWKMAGALVAGLIGMGMLFWALEKTSLTALADGGNAETARAPFSVYLVLFAGLLLINFSLFYAVVRWSRFLREHPETSQMPLWLAIIIVVVAASALIAGIAIHAAWLNDQDPVPTTVNEGLILYEVVMGALVLIPLVLVGVRWAPGYKRQVSEA